MIFMTVVDLISSFHHTLQRLTRNSPGMPLLPGLGSKWDVFAGLLNQNWEKSYKGAVNKWNSFEQQNLLNIHKKRKQKCCICFGGDMRIHIKTFLNLILLRCFSVFLFSSIKSIEISSFWKIRWGHKGKFSVGFVASP